MASMDYAEGNSNSTEGLESLAKTLCPAISIKNISKSFGTQKVLTDISLDLTQGIA